MMNRYDSFDCVRILVSRAAGGVDARLNVAKSMGTYRRYQIQSLLVTWGGGPDHIMRSTYNSSTPCDPNSGARRRTISSTTW